MSHGLYPQISREFAEKRRQLSPDAEEAFQNFSKAVFAEGALSAKLKQLIAVAVAHTTQCPYCIKGHTRAAMRMGASEKELMEAIWVAAEMRAGGAYAHSILAIEEMENVKEGSHPADLLQITAYFVGRFQFAVMPIGRFDPRQTRVSTEDGPSKLTRHAGCISL